MTGILLNIQGRPIADVSFYVHKNILTEMKHFRHIRCIMGERPFKESTSKMLTKEEFTCLARKYMDTVFRVAMNYLKNKTDADDVTQNVLLKFYKSDVDFESEEHVKHWLIRVTLNECKNFLRFPWQKYASLEDYMETLQMPEPEHREMLNAVMALPTKYRMILYLYYYEGYATAEIAEFLQVPNGTVRTRLARGREQLKKILKEAE